MMRITAYRVQISSAPDGYETGTNYHLERPSYDSEEYAVKIEPVCVQLAKDVRAARSGAGTWLLYRDYHAYGLRLPEALQAGWVELLDSVEGCLGDVNETANEEKDTHHAARKHPHR